MSTAYVLKTEDNQRMQQKTNEQVQLLTLQQSQSQDAKAKIHQGLTQRQQALQLLFVLQHESS